MTTDPLGNPVTPAAAPVLAGIGDFVLGFLSYDPRAARILAAAEAAPDHCLANAYAAMLWMFLEAPEAPARAAPHVARALAAAPRATPREAGAARLVAAWAEGDIPGAIAIAEALVRDHPRDLTALKLGQYHLFNRGDALGLLRLGLAALPAAEGMPYLHGMIAFGYEQCHLLRAAEAAARRALQIAPTDPWAQHALAHVMLTEGRIDAGIAFLEGVAPQWAGLNSFMRAHNWWHLALFYLSRWRIDAALAAYDAHVWGLEKSYSQDQVGAVSLLARFEMAGVDVGPRWQDVADHVAARGADTVNPFLTLQYLYALARTARPEAEGLMAAIRARAEAPAHDRAAWAEVALPAAEGIVAHLQGRPEAAVAELVRALPRLAEIGGSHAQRDLFEQIHLAALLAAGRDSAAQQVLELRRGFDPDGVPVNRALARLYARAGLPGLAAEAEARAARTAAAAPPAPTPA